MRILRIRQFLLTGLALLCACAAQAQTLAPNPGTSPSQPGVVAGDPRPPAGQKPIIIRPHKPKPAASAPASAARPQKN